MKIKIDRARALERKCDHFMPSLFGSREQRNPKVRKMEQQRCKVRIPKRRKSFVSHIFSRNDAYYKAYLSDLTFESYIIRSS